MLAGMKNPGPALVLSGTNGTGVKKMVFVFVTLTARLETDEDIIMKPGGEPPIPMIPARAALSEMLDSVSLASLARNSRSPVSIAK